MTRKDIGDIMITHPVSIRHDSIRCNETIQTIRDNDLKLYFLQFILDVKVKNFTSIYAGSMFNLQY